RARQQHVAAQYAMHLSALNDQRRAMQADMQAEAQQALEQHQELKALPADLALFDEHWHEGIVGLLAGRLCERYRRPVGACAPAGAGGHLRGPARANDGLHIRAVLAGMATSDASLMTRFGGHAHAAGLTLEHARLADFGRVFADSVATRLSPALLDDRIV